METAARPLFVEQLFAAGPSRLRLIHVTLDDWCAGKGRVMGPFDRARSGSFGCLGP